MSAPPTMRLVLVHPEQPRNVGSVIRATANSGLKGISIVRNAPFTTDELRLIQVASSGAFNLVKIELFSDLKSAVTGTNFVLGTSGRHRSVQIPLVSSLAEADPVPQPIAVVFGAESSGLSTQDLLLCHALLRLPVSENFPSLNLSHAVAIVLHQWSTSRTAPPPSCPAPSASRDNQEIFLARLSEKTAVSAQTLAQMRRLLHRAGPTDDDMAMLFNLLKSRKD